MQAAWRAVFQLDVWTDSDFDKAPGKRGGTGVFRKPIYFFFVQASRRGSLEAGISSLHPSASRVALRCASGGTLLRLASEARECMCDHTQLSEMRQTLRTYLACVNDWDAEAARSAAG